MQFPSICLSSPDPQMHRDLANPFIFMIPRWLLCITPLTLVDIGLQELLLEYLDAELLSLLEIRLQFCGNLLRPAVSAIVHHFRSLAVVSVNCLAFTVLVT